MKSILLLDVRLVALAVILLLICPLGGDTWTGRLRHHKHFGHKETDTIYGRDIPVLKMLKRQVRHFREGRRASVTLVFRSSKSVSVRWFKRAAKFNMPNSEVPNMVPLEGDPKYNVVFISSGEVMATTLIIPNFNLSFPQDFETIITTDDSEMQYQISTMVKEVTGMRLDTIDSPEWMAIPPPDWSFNEHQPFKVHCKAFVPNEDRSSDNVNELIMYRAIPARDNSFQGNRQKKAKMEIQSVFGIHKSTQNYAEENGAAIFQGERKELKYGHVLYELKLRTTNATLYYEGIYQCAIERKFDKLFVSSVMTLYGNRSPLPPIPRLDIISCKLDNFNINILRLSEGEESCLRCRAIGYPTPEVGVFRADRELKPNRYLGVSKFISLVDGGVSEATYTFRGTYGVKRGRYTCRAFNVQGSSTLSFKIDY